MLSRPDDPDQQIPMPFPAAETYASTVMAWSRQVALSHLPVWRDQAYGSHRLQRFDVFAPKGSRNSPALLFFHGGGWTNGYRNYGHFMAPLVTALGMVLITPSYRLVTEARFPAAVDDAQACAEHLINHASQYGLDPEQLLLSGHSAGGHLAAMVSLRANLPIKACLPISGIMDLHHPNPQPGSLEARVYEMVLPEPSLDALMSPIAWAKGNLVPFDLSVGEHDSPRVQSSNARLFELLKAQGGAARLTINPGENHFDTHTRLSDPNHPWYSRLKAFA